jgi:hypothetical protein
MNTIRKLIERLLWVNDINEEPFVSIYRRDSKGAITHCGRVPVAGVNTRSEIFVNEQDIKWEKFP